MSELIFDVEKFVNDFNLKSVKLFIPKEYPLYSLATAAALSAYLNKVCKIPTTLVANQSKIEDVSMCIPLAESPDTIKKNANDFLAIIIDCPDVESCDNDAFNRTFCALQIRGRVSMKDFGAEAFNDNDALCAAEIVYYAIQNHIDVNYTYCKEAYDYLYLAMLDATSVFKLHMKTKTFETIQEIIMCGAEVNIKPECFKKKKTDEIKILEYIYTNFRIKNEVGHIMFLEDEWKKLSSSSFQNVLEYIRFVKIVEVWCAFVKEKYDYTAYIQGNASGKFDITKTLKKYKATGSRKKTKCKIKEYDITKILDTMEKMIETGKLKQKPRKKYTHKIKKDQN